MLKTCVICGSQFETTKSNVICCSEECKHERHKQNMKKYYRLNKEKHLRVCSERQKARRAEYTETLRRFRKRHPEAAAIYVNRYLNKKAESLGITKKELNRRIYEAQAQKRGMTPSEYSKYCVERRAMKFGLTYSEFSKLIYRARKENVKVYELLGLTESEYKERLKMKIEDKVTNVSSTEVSNEKKNIFSVLSSFLKRSKNKEVDKSLVM